MGVDDREPGRWACVPVTDQQDWDSLLGRTSRCDLMQTWAYGEAVRDCVGWEPVRQLISYDDTPVALAQLLVREVPLVGTVARVLHGPVFLEAGGGVPSPTTAGVLTTLREHWVEGRSAALHLSPYLPPADQAPAWEQLGFRPSGETAWGSIRVDVTPAAETLRQNFGSRQRRALAQAESYGLESSVSRDPADLARFLRLQETFRQDRGFTWPSPALVRALWRQTGERSELLLVRQGDTEILGGVMVTSHDTALLFAYYARPTAGALRASQFAYWKAILRAKERGLRWLDVGGVDDRNLPGLSSFKRGLLPSGEEYRLPGAFEARPRRAPAGQLAHDESLDGVLPGAGFEATAQAHETVKDQVLTMVQTFLAESLDWDGPVDEEIELITSGLVDSLSLLELMAQIERRFSLAIEPGDIVLDHFNTPSAIADFVSGQSN
ncbi:GNAT family N-acetyltransferase [Actinoplanes sp. NPDC049265]|uniref:GNAT family N-acetyltransferase n=1 Tax=Actinoplanes sp. NPDC049265 TaxID=3363902 RepID=UPI0037130975